MTASFSWASPVLPPEGYSRAETQWRPAHSPYEPSATQISTGYQDTDNGLSSAATTFMSEGGDSPVFQLPSPRIAIASVEELIAAGAIEIDPRGEDYPVASWAWAQAARAEQALPTEGLELRALLPDHESEGISPAHSTTSGSRTPSPTGDYPLPVALDDAGTVSPRKEGHTYTPMGEQLVSAKEYAASRRAAPLPKYGPPVYRAPVLRSRTYGEKPALETGHASIHHAHALSTPPGLPGTFGMRPLPLLITAPPVKPTVEAVVPPAVAFSDFAAMDVRQLKDVSDGYSWGTVDRAQHATRVPSRALPLTPRVEADAAATSRSATSSPSPSPTVHYGDAIPPEPLPVACLFQLNTHTRTVTAVTPPPVAVATAPAYPRARLVTGTTATSHAGPSAKQPPTGSRFARPTVTPASVAPPTPARGFVPAKRTPPPPQAVAYAGTYAVGSRPKLPSSPPLPRSVRPPVMGDRTSPYVLAARRAAMAA